MRYTAFILLSLFITSVSAQKGPSFGKIDKAELESKECAYDKSAEAECLYDYGEVNFFINGDLLTNERIIWARIKIYNDKALDRANIKVPFFTKGNNVSISKITGYTYNINEHGEVEKTELEKNAVYRQKINEYYDEMVFSLPKVKAGSVFEYKYTVIKKNALELDNWVFQQSIPVKESRYDVGVLAGLGFNYKVIKRMPVEEKEEDGSGSSKRKIFIMRKIPGLKPEPYMSSRNDYFQRVEFQLSSINGRPRASSTWKGFSDLLMNDEGFGLQLKKNVLGTTDIGPKLKQVSGTTEKINLVYKYVQQHIKWNGSNEYLCSKNVKKTAELKEGNSADVNILLINLLLDAGIDAKPLLVSTRPHGKINMSFPFQSQFDNVYAYIETENNVYVLDATNKYNPFYLIPWDVQFSVGFVVDKNMPQFVNIGDVKNKYKVTTVIQTEINQDGMANGIARNYALEYAKVERMNALGKGKEEYKQKHYLRYHKECSFDSIDIKNQDKDSLGLESSVAFKTELSKSGEYIFYNLNFLSGFADNPFLSDERVSTIEFGYNQAHVITGRIGFEESLVPEELPKNIKMIMPDSSIVLQRICQLNGNNIDFRIVVNINRPSYFADEYLDFKAFYAALIDKLNEQLVFKKKSQPAPESK
ncbi:MAG TPA: DUF3857 domain-containing protein [Lacibacter sp.]|nr:DUF3857 domain-containing protein [Lacibacter sp.]